MTKETFHGLEGFERRPLLEYAEKAYLDYSMYVILDRALPSITDGLKPVQRRIIYAMSDLGLGANSKPKKSARTIGDVIGKFHPHGDSACYEAMVLMAQPFSTRYPLIEGQGNFGSPDDPKSFAAMRYTESKMTQYARTLLQELEQGTVEWQANFDGTLKEPAFMPARLPNVLLNGASGIAVGMATDVPPHNLREVVNACLRLLKNSRTPLSEIREYIKGPDYPTSAEIISSAADIDKMYETGHGSVRMRAVYEKQDGAIIVSALPHQVSPAKILEQIAQQMRAKKLPWLEDLRDESDHENPIRLVLIPRSNRVDVEQLMSHLFATTDMERTYRVNMNVIGIDGKPRVKNLKEILLEWLEFRTETVRRRLQFRLDQVLARLHILEGLLTAFLNIDEVIRIIRSEDKPKPVLMHTFAISDLQAEAILDLKLRHLAKLEEVKIRGEQEALEKERAQLEYVLGTEKHLKALVRQELKADADKYGDDRRSPIVAREIAQAIDEKSLIPSEPVTVVLSKMGWVRAAKGHEIDAAGLNYRAGDEFASTAIGRSNQNAIFLDSDGRAYSLPAHGLPSARSQGEPLTGRFSPAPGASFKAILMGEDDATWLMSSDFGYGFVTRLQNLHSRNKAGKHALSLPVGASVMTPVKICNPENDLIVCATTSGYLLAFPATELPELTKGKGNKMINIPTKNLKSGEEKLAGVTVIGKGQHCLVWAGQRYLRLKRAELDHFVSDRALRGKKLPRGFQRVDRLESAKPATAIPAQ